MRLNHRLVKTRQNVTRQGKIEDFPALFLLLLTQQMHWNLLGNTIKNNSLFLKSTVLPNICASSTISSLIILSLKQTFSFLKNL